MSQNSDDYRNNPRPPRPPHRDNSNRPNSEPDYGIHSLMFDEYGEVKANPQLRPTPPLQPKQGWNKDEAPSVPSLIFDEYGELKPITPDLRQQVQIALPARPAAPGSNGIQDPYKAPSVPSLMFDEYGELKSSALNGFKPAQPQPGAQPRFNPPGPVQSPAQQLPGRPTNVNQGPPSYPVPVPVVPPAANPVPTSAPLPVVKKSGGRMGSGLWITLGAVGIVLLIAIGLMLLLVLNKPATPIANTTPVSLSSLLPFKALTPGATTAGPTLTGPTANAPTGDLDTLYNQATAQLKNNQFKEAAATLEQLRDKQNQSGTIKHPDVPSLLFRAYVNLGDQLNKSARFADFQQSMVNYQKAIDTTNTLDAKDRNQQEETALQARLDTGNLYIKAVTAYNQKNLDAAVPIFSQLYGKNQNFRDASNLYYDSLIRIGDGQFAENLLPEAYQSYGRATQLKNVTDTRYAQARTTSIESQLRQAGKPVPAIPAP